MIPSALNWRMALLGVATCAIVLNSTTAAVSPLSRAPKANAADSAGNVDAQAAVGRIARQVRAIEKQAGKMRRIESDADLIGIISTCCIDTTLYVDGKEIRKAVVKSWHGMDGFTMEWYFAGGKPIFVVETNQYQNDAKNVRPAAKRVAREIRVPEMLPEEQNVGPQCYAKGELKLTLCRWQNRYYIDDGRMVRGTTDCPLKDGDSMMSASMVRQIAAAILKSGAKRQHNRRNG